MKICIFTGRFGMGHYAAALALKQQIEESRLDADTEIIDWLSYASPRFAEKYYSFYRLLVNWGKGFYNTWYRLSENKKPDQKPELGSYFESCFSKFMEEKEPDLIISTLPICSQIVSVYKEKTGCGIPLVTCVTDITDHSQWINKNTGLYLVGSRFVKEKFIGKGVPPEKIHVTGIPVRLDFIRNPSPKLKTFDNRLKHLLIMGGGLGMLPEDMGFYEGLNSIPETEITVITGKNTRLFYQLKDKFQNINVLGFVENISDYMRQADLIVTKPGGITTFEAIHTEVPIIALNPLLQQEIYNANYIQEMQIGTTVTGNSNECLEQINYILGGEKLKDYRNNIRRIREHLNESSLTQILRDTVYSKYLLTGSLTAKYKNRNEDITINEKVSFNI